MYGFQFNKNQTFDYNMNIKICPICESDDIQFKKGIYNLTDENKIIKSIPNVKYYKCNNCGEKFVFNNEVEKIVPNRTNKYCAVV